MKPMKIRFSITSPKDIDAIAAIHREVLSHLKWSYDKKYLRRMIEFEDCNCWTMKLRGKVIGSLHFYCEKEFTLNTIAILKKHQRKGYGRRSMMWVEMAAKLAGYGFVKLWSLDRCIAYYEKLGYQQVKKSGEWTLMKKVLV